MAKAAQGDFGARADDQDVGDVLFSEDAIAAAVAEIAARIDADYADKVAAGEELVLCGVLTGAYVFQSDLARKLKVKHVVDFIKASSYGSSTVTTGEVKIELDTASSLSGKHVLLIEDIIDTGVTLKNLSARVRSQGCKSVELVALLDKRERRKVELEGKYVGFVCPNEFVVGYGLDFAARYRSLPYVGVLKPSVYSSPPEDETQDTIG